MARATGHITGQPYATRDGTVCALMKREGGVPNSERTIVVAFPGRALADVAEGQDVTARSDGERWVVDQ